MASVHDVAAYVLQRAGGMTTIKLQQLVCYVQAWHLVELGVPLFPEHIEAWVNGPVVPALFQLHQAKFRVATLPKGDPCAIPEQSRGAVDRLLDAFGDMGPQALVRRAQAEEPWQHARRGLADDEPGARRITTAVMLRFYRQQAEDACDLADCLAAIEEANERGWVRHEDAMAQLEW